MTHVTCNEKVETETAFRRATSKSEKSAVLDDVMHMPKMA